MATRAAGVTVRLAEPVIAPEVAVIMVVPAVMPVAKPMVGTESLMVATTADEDAQETSAERS